MSWMCETCVDSHPGRHNFCPVSGKPRPRVVACDPHDDYLLWRVDVFCAGGWQHLASFAGEADAYEYGERCSLSGARVWKGDECLGLTGGPRSWRAAPAPGVETVRAKARAQAQALVRMREAQDGAETDDPKTGAE